MDDSTLGMGRECGGEKFLESWGYEAINALQGWYYWHYWYYWYYCLLGTTTGSSWPCYTECNSSSPWEFGWERQSQHFPVFNKNTFNPSCAAVTAKQPHKNQIFGLFFLPPDVSVCALSVRFTLWSFAPGFCRMQRGMETPLDVLSRAASLVHADDEKREFPALLGALLCVCTVGPPGGCFDPPWNFTEARMCGKLFRIM